MTIKPTGSPRHFFPPEEHGTQADVPASQAAEPDHPDIVRGVDAVGCCGAEHGMAEAHLALLAAYAQKKNVAIGFRPVNMLATSLIERGHPTKGLKIKGKTANWGPMAGFIPVSQKFSKSHGSPADIAFLDSQVRQCIADGHAESMPLQIERTRLEELSRLGVIHLTEPSVGAPIGIHATKNHVAHLFQAYPTNAAGTGPYAIFSNQKAVQVLARQARDADTGKPRSLTADYDMLFFGVGFDQLGAKDNYGSPRPTTAAQNRAGSNAPDGLSSEHGISSPRLVESITEMNTALGRSSANQLIHHGPDTHNPYAVHEDNYPSVIFVPKTDAESADVVMVRNAAAARIVFRRVKERFHFFSNKKWGSFHDEVRRPSFDIARESIQEFTKSPRPRSKLTKLFPQPEDKKD